ncbi:O-antigen ligase family protein [Gordonia rubripertincta]|uniref:O-antigen ligase family protein n=1 Tax=Gordonia rubripertincta TaxID=36822 RepID=A0AAW6RIH3_GORRU|nr:O-antigen ligase family protein [Gordonia rubripertincta]MDG6783822.1 O-antigen ligase family protein [Gordonia rubripertincta]NKY64412.1 O-antigen ligase family protein [Gordonia rubripertincta]
MAYVYLIASYLPPSQAVTTWTAAVGLYAVLVLAFFVPRHVLAEVGAVVGIVGVVLIPNFGAPLSVKAPLAGVLAALLMVSVARFGLPDQIGKPLAFLAGFFIYALVSALSYGAMQSVQSLTLQIATVFPIAAFLLQLDGRRLERLLWTVCWIGVIEAVWAVANALEVLPLPWGILGKELGAEGQVHNLIEQLTVRGSGSLAHPLACGWFLAFCVVLLGKLSGRSRVLRSIFAVLYIAGIVFTGTRSALIIVTLTCVAILIISWRNIAIPAKIAAVFVPVALALVSAISFESLILEPLGLYGVDNTASYYQRADSADAFFALLNAPVSLLVFGGNPDQLSTRPEFYYLAQNGIFAIDNQWVSALAKTGVIGLVLLLMFISGVFRRSRSRFPCALFLVGSTLAFSPLDWNIGVVMWVILALPQVPQREPGKNTAASPSVVSDSEASNVVAGGIGKESAAGVI